MRLWQFNINIIYLTLWKVQFREIFQVSNETVIVGSKWTATRQRQALQIRVQGHDIR